MHHEHSLLSTLRLFCHASLPMLLMLFIEMALNHYFAPINSIFISPYLLTFFVLGGINFLVFGKGEICHGQMSRFIFVCAFLFIFAIGNLAYTLVFTPKHAPLIVASCASLFFPAIFLLLSKTDEKVKNTLILCGFAIVGVGVLQYLLVYWIELPSRFNWLRANNFAQILLGVLLSGWYLMLAKSRLEQFLKWLVKLAIIMLILNYLWSIYAVYAYIEVVNEVNFISIILYAVVQFIILALLGGLLLGKNIKNPTAWTMATLLAMFYPLINAI